MLLMASLQANAEAADVHRHGEAGKGALHASHVLDSSHHSEPSTRSTRSYSQYDDACHHLYELFKVRRRPWTDVL